jgi:hypothetical protein
MSREGCIYCPIKMKFVRKITGCAMIIQCLSLIYTLAHLMPAWYAIDLDGKQSGLAFMRISIYVIFQGSEKYIHLE